jgi:hypothetical protein
MQKLNSQPEKDNMKETYFTQQSSQNIQNAPV